MAKLINFELTDRRIEDVIKFQQGYNAKTVNTKTGMIKCNVCGYETNMEFMAYGNGNRPNEKCPNCYSLKRTRLIWFYLNNYTDFLKRNDTKILHTAPETCFYKILKTKYGDNYISSDVELTQYVDQYIDLQDIPYPDNTFDLVITSHVLEHVPDDNKALKELYRVLKPKGEAVILVPYMHELKKTFEFEQINTDELRQRYYKQFDHQRYYGRDLVDKIEKTGFKVKKEFLFELKSYPEEIEFYQLSKDPMFVGVKPE